MHLLFQEIDKKQKFYKQKYSFFYKQLPIIQIWN